MDDIVERLREHATDWNGEQMPDLEPAKGDPTAGMLRHAADAIESLRAENARLKSEAASMWRGGVSNTVAVVDQVRNKFAKGLKLKKNVRLAHFDAELDIALGEWFNATRCISPTSYHESEDVFRALAKIKGGPDAR